MSHQRSKQGRPILIGQAEEIDHVPPEIKKMIGNEGMYMVADPNAPFGEVPIVSMNGKLFCMVVDKELDPEKFLPGILVAGPLRAPEIPR